MIYLQSKRVYSQILELNPQTGEHGIVGREALSAHGRMGGINGVFDVLNEILVALYALNGKLILRVGDKTMPLSEGITASLSGDPSQRLLRVMQGGIDLVQARYDIRDSLRDKDDPTPFIEDEDADFGLFIANVLSDPSRRRVFLDRW